MSVEVPQLVGMNGTQAMSRLERVIRTAQKEEVEQSLVRKRWQEAERERKESGRARTKDGMGELKRIIPAREFHRWIQFHGDSAIWSDKQWLREWDRDNPQFKVK